MPLGGDRTGNSFIPREQDTITQLPYGRIVKGEGARRGYLASGASLTVACSSRLAGVAMPPDDELRVECEVIEVRPSKSRPAQGLSSEPPP
jgi:hypothetical protein